MSLFKSKVWQWLVALAAVAVSLEYKDDLDQFRRTVYLRENDRFNLQFGNMLYVNGQSVNFYCDNAGVTVPGVALEAHTPSEAAMKEFRSAFFLSYNNYLFFILENKLEYMFYRVKEDNKEIELLKNNHLLATINALGHGQAPPGSVPEDDELPSEAQGKKHFEPNTRLKLAQAVLLPPARIVLFTHKVEDLLNEDRTHDEYKYHFICYNFAKNKLEYTVRVTGQYFDHPTIRLFSNPANTKDDVQTIFIAFNQDDHSEGRFEAVKKLTIFEARLRPGSKTWMADQRSVYIYDIIKELDNVFIRLMDVQLSPGEDPKDYFAYFFIKKLDTDNVIKYEVYQCRFDYKADLTQPHLFFRDCGLFRKRDRRYMLLKNQIYISLERFGSSKEVINFCTVSREYCKMGTLDQGWEVQQVMIEATYGVVLLKIAGVHVLAVNDFLTNELVYFYEDMTGVKSVHLQQQIVDGKPRLYLIRIYETSFNRKDITLKLDTEIEGRDIVNMEPIHVKLENEPFQEIKVVKWDGLSIIDTHADRPITVLRLPDGTFRTKLGFAGSNLNFIVDQNKGMIFHFNPARFRLVIDPQNFPRSQEPFYIFKNYLVYADFIIITECDNDPYEMQLICTARDLVPHSPSINVTAITGVSEMRDLLVFWGYTSEQIRFFDRTHKHFVDMKMPGRFKESPYCTHTESFLLCQYVLPNGIQELRLFEVFRDHIVEISRAASEIWGIIEREILLKEFGPKFKDKKMSELLGKSISVKIQDVGFDKIRTRYLYIFFTVSVDGTNTYHIVELLLNPLPAEGHPYLRFVQRMIQYERNQNNSPETYFFVMGSKILFVTRRPKAMMWMVSDDSHSAFEFIDMQSIIKMIFEENYNLLVVIYVHHENNLPYFAIFRLTMNSVRQLIRNEVIPDFRNSTRLTLIPVTSGVMAVVIYDLETHRVTNSYFYFLDGPFYQHSNFQEPVRIDDHQFFMQFQEDYNFNTNLVKYISDKVIALDKFQNSKTIIIQKYIEIIGNIRDINIVGEYAGKSQIAMRRPLSLYSETYIGECDGDDCDEVALGSDDEYIIFRTSDEHPNYTLRSKTRLHSAHSFTINLPDKYMCQEMILSRKKVLCFWMEGAKARMTVQFIEVGDQRSVTYDLPVAVEKPVILYDHAGTIIIAFVDKEYYRQVGVYQFSLKETEKTVTATDGNTTSPDATKPPSKPSNDIKWLQISSKELLCDELKITAYAAFSHVESDSLYVIIMDSWSNSLYLFKSTLREKKEIPTLKNNIPLDPLDVLFYHMSCEFDADQTTFECFLFSANYIFRTRIGISKDTIISDYKWVFETKSRFYNAIYESTLDNDFQIEMRTHGNKVIIFEKHPYVESQKGLIYYDLDSANPNHSNFIYDLSSHENILDIMFEPSLNQIHIYFTEKTSIRRTALAISEYAIDIVNIARPSESDDPDDDEDLYDGGVVLDKDLEIVIEFKNSNRYAVTFSFENKKAAEEKGSTDKAKTTPILLTAVLVVSVLILSLVLSLVILLEKRKRYELRLLRLQLPGEETQSMLSDSR